jgi:hypothetical protein
MTTLAGIIGIPGRLGSESVAAIVGMFEGSTGSREVSVCIATMRDVVEAGLNEAASTPDGYGF